VVVRRIEQVASRRLAGKFAERNDRSDSRDRPSSDGNRPSSDDGPTDTDTETLLNPLTHLEEVQLLDTTLRDGEQMPGVSLTPADKLEVARELDAAGVHVIEAGSACTSEGEREGIRRVAREGLDATVTSFARGVRSDIDRALDCDVDGVNLVVPASDRHVETKVGSSREEVLETTVDLVEYATDHGLWVEVLGEDGSRADLDYLERLMKVGLDAGADRVCYCDTVGAAGPEHTAEVVSRLAELGPTSLHTHDDLGFGVANVHAGLKAAQTRFTVPSTGVGERAGQRCHRGGRHRARSLLRRRHDRDRATLPALSTRLRRDGSCAPAEQSRLWNERLRPRVGDPHRRNAEGRGDVRAVPPGDGGSRAAARVG